MQNTIVKELEGRDDVVTLIYNEGGRYGETLEWTKTFWENYFLRGALLFDATGDTSRRLFGQPATGLPFGRGFIIDRDGTVALPYFGHNPAAALAAIRALLPATPAVRAPRGSLRRPPGP